MSAAGRDDDDAQKDGPQAEDADFLAREFGIAPRRAGELVARDGARADDVAAAARERAKRRDPLAGAPVPDEPGRDRVPDSDEVRLKQVLHEKNDRRGGG
jgi:hypothetical protein